MCIHMWSDIANDWITCVSNCTDVVNGPLWPKKEGELYCVQRWFYIVIAAPCGNDQVCLTGGLIHILHRQLLIMPLVLSNVQTLVTFFKYSPKRQEVNFSATEVMWSITFLLPFHTADPVTWYASFCINFAWGHTCPPWIVHTRSYCIHKICKLTHMIICVHWFAVPAQKELAQQTWIGMLTGSHSSTAKIFARVDLQTCLIFACYLTNVLQKKPC